LGEGYLPSQVQNKVAKRGGGHILSHGFCWGGGKTVKVVKPAARGTRHLNEQKFFGAFLQKRTACLLPGVQWRVR
jgi:dienelactone hydrolase